MDKKRDAYVEKMKAKLDEWNADIDILAAKAKKAQADTRVEYEEQLKDLRKQRDTVKKKLKEIQNSSDAAWENLKSGFENAAETLGKAFTNAKSQFNR